ncbi:MAG: hypothetical protein ACXWK1_19010, partial [Caulobacteraceae bacterium]
MAADFSSPDPKALWQDQERETDPITLDQIHAMVRRYDRRTQRTVMVFPVLLVVVGFFGGELWIKAHEVWGRVMAVAFILGETSTCFLVWRMLYPARDAAEPAGAYLRRRLLRRLAYLMGRWIFAVLPRVPAIALSKYLTFTPGRGWWAARATPL